MERRVCPRLPIQCEYEPQFQLTILVFHHQWKIPLDVGLIPPIGGSAMMLLMEIYPLATRAAVHQNLRELKGEPSRQRAWAYVATCWKRQLSPETIAKFPDCRLCFHAVFASLPLIISQMPLSHNFIESISTYIVPALHC